MFFLMPETRNRTLEDIEDFFADNDRKLFDRNIRRYSLLQDQKEIGSDEDKQHINNIET